MTPISIHIADKTHADVITNVGIKSFVEAFGKHNTKSDMDKYLAEEMSLEKITAEIEDKGNTFYLASYGIEPVGFAKVRNLYIPPELEDQNALEIERIYVLEQFHDKKIGAALMQCCIDHALNLGFTTIWLGVWEQNHKAVNFYNRWGFQLFGSHPFVLGEDVQTDVLMKKSLAL